MDGYYKKLDVKLAIYYKILCKQIGRLLRMREYSVLKIEYYFG